MIKVDKLLDAVRLRISQLKERRKALLDGPHGHASIHRIEGNIGALEQVERWITGVEEIGR